jgi:hypothetical protein
MAAGPFYAVGWPKKNAWNERLTAKSPVFFRDNRFATLSN